MPDGTRWDGIANSDPVHVGNDLPTDEDKQEEVLLWVDTDEPDVTIGYEIYTGDTEPTEESYDLWIDTSKSTRMAMPADALKYKAFTINDDQWIDQDSIFIYQLEAPGITEDSAVINLTLDSNSQMNQKAQLNWETGEDYIILSTTIKPTGTLSGYLIAAEVTII